MMVQDSCPSPGGPGLCLPRRLRARKQEKDNQGRSSRLDSAAPGEWVQDDTGENSRPASRARSLMGRDSICSPSDSVLVSDSLMPLEGVSPSAKPRTSVEIQRLTSACLRIGISGTHSKDQFERALRQPSETHGVSPLST